MSTRWTRTLLALAVVAIVVALVSRDDEAGFPPSFASVRDDFRPSESRLLDRHGVLLQERRTDTQVRRLGWVRLEEISPALTSTLLVSEDRRFHTHGGVDVLALGAAIRDGLLGGRRRGASTITMQVAALLQPELRAARGGRTWLQKLRQMRAARALEARWTKDEILEAHLNLASFRGELQGVGAAARGLLGVEPHGIVARDALVLAALLRAPNARPDAVAERVRDLARRVTPAVDPGSAALRAREILSQPPTLPPSVALAPHVAARLLVAGAAPEIRTTLDARLQEEAARILREQLLALSTRNVRDGAVLVVDNRSGDILAWVGSSGTLSAASQVDAVRARRQAGSTLKPFLYATAFDERRLTPASHLEDAPLEVATPTGIYRPENYDRVFRGLVSARVALASSLNVPAVRTVQLVGVERFVERLGALGFSELRRPDHYGESLALGSADVTLLELVNAYRTLANGGVSDPLRLRPDDPRAEPVRVFSEAASFLVADILADRSSRSATFGFESPLATPFYAAVKTGTSKDMRDNWCIGFTSGVTVGVWVGNSSGAPMWQVSGVDGAAPAWLALVRSVERERPSALPSTPEGVIRRDGELYLAGTEPVGAPTRGVPSPHRIRAPAEGTIVALDPDIPTDRQRVFFESEPRDPALRFRVDGALLGDAADVALWAPVRGRHHLELVDAEGRTRDAVRFEVR